MPFNLRIQIYDFRVAYKNIEAVIADLVDAGLVSVIATFRPLLTYKTRKVRR